MKRIQALIVCLPFLLGGCAVVELTADVVGAAVDVTAATAGAAIAVTGAAAAGAIGLMTGGDDEDEDGETQVEEDGVQTDDPEAEERAPREPQRESP
jgi:sugar (pentulose or hexulose) kinase